FSYAASSSTQDSPRTTLRASRSTPTAAPRSRPSTRRTPRSSASVGPARSTRTDNNENDYDRKPRTHSARAASACRSLRARRARTRLLVRRSHARAGSSDGAGAGGARPRDSVGASRVGPRRLALLRLPTQRPARLPRTETFGG